LKQLVGGVAGCQVVVAGHGEEGAAMRVVEGSWWWWEVVVVVRWGFVVKEDMVQVGFKEIQGRLVPLKGFLR